MLSCARSRRDAAAGERGQERSSQEYYIVSILSSGSKRDSIVLRIHVLRKVNQDYERVHYSLCTLSTTGVDCTSLCVRGRNAIGLYVGRYFPRASSVAFSCKDGGGRRLVAGGADVSAIFIEQLERVRVNAFLQIRASMNVHGCRRQWGSAGCMIILKAVINKGFYPIA